MNTVKQIRSLKLTEKLPANLTGASYSVAGKYVHSSGAFTKIKLSKKRLVVLTLKGTVAPGATGEVRWGVFVATPKGMKERT